MSLVYNQRISLTQFQETKKKIPRITRLGLPEHRVHCREAILRLPAESRAISHHSRQPAYCTPGDSRIYKSETVEIGCEGTSDGWHSRRVQSWSQQKCTADRTSHTAGTKPVVHANVSPHLVLEVRSKAPIPNTQRNHQRTAVDDDDDSIPSRHARRDQR
jgi:hypothetical protein